jgi:hypothetical protein
MGPGPSKSLVGKWFLYQTFVLALPFISIVLKDDL